MKLTYNLPCNIAQTLNIVGDRWSLLIVHEVLKGNTLFSEIKKALPGISSNLLSGRLRYLERAGLISADLYSTHPPRYRYTLTNSGRELEHVFNAFIIWGSHHLPKCYKKLIDAETGDEVEIAYYNKKTGEMASQLEVVSIDAMEKAGDQ